MESLDWSNTAISRQRLARGKRIHAARTCRRFTHRTSSRMQKAATTTPPIPKMSGVCASTAAYKRKCTNVTLNAAHKLRAALAFNSDFDKISRPTSHAP